MLLKQHQQREIAQLSPREIATLLHYFKNGVIAFDVETTGLSPMSDRIIELSAIRIRPNHAIATFSELINPQKEIGLDTQKIHGISNEMVKKAPFTAQVIKNFLEFAGDLPLIGHNAKFDASFLASALHFNSIDFPKNKIYCSLQIAKDGFKQMPSYKLGELAKRLNIALENHHRALDDSIASLRLFALSLQKLEKQNNRNLFHKSYLFSMDQFSSKREFEIPEHLSALKDATKRRNLIEIKYKGGSHRGKFRPVKPIALLPLPTGAILYALCLLSDQHKSFKLTKISAIRQPDEKELK